MQPPNEIAALDDEVQARKKRRRREFGYWVFFFIFSLPVLIGIYLVLRSQRQIAKEQAWAVAELAKPQPDPQAWGVRGAGLLSDGKAAEALPLLKRAADIEEKEGPRAGVKALCMLVEAHLDGLKQGVPAASKPEALALLRNLETRALTLPPGPAAAAWHAAGKLYGHLDAKIDALRCLRHAVELQPDDWFVGFDGQRYKHRGIASIYDKDLAAAEMD